MSAPEAGYDGPHGCLLFMCDDCYIAWWQSAPVWWESEAPKRQTQFVGEVEIGGVPSHLAEAVAFLKKPGAWAVAVDPITPEDSGLRVCCSHFPRSEEAEQAQYDWRFEVLTAGLKES